MRILFCKISYMKFYKGVCGNDEPYNGGQFVIDNGYGHEEFNFLPIEFHGLQSKQKYCMGFVETKETRKGIRNQLHIEKIAGGLKNQDSLDEVLVVWCATSQLGETTVVGWYKKATVYRRYQQFSLEFEDGMCEERLFNICAKTEDCVLLPDNSRRRWEIPIARYNKKYGFGQALLWYATEESALNYIEQLLDKINNYNGENWINIFPNQD